MTMRKSIRYDEDGNERNSRWAAYVKRGADAVYKTFFRFPVTIILVAALAILLIYRIETPYEVLVSINTMLDRIMAVIVLGIPLSLCVDLLLERMGKHIYQSIRLASYVVELGVLVLYYMFLIPEIGMVTMVRLILVTGALVLGFFFIPYLPSKDNFEVYITKVLSRAVVTCFFAVVLGLGLTAIIFAVKSLLLSGLSEQLYGHAWILVLTIFTSFYFLSGLPHIEESFPLDQFNKVLKVLLLYIVLPIISVYTVVLYIYFTKIIVTQVWPEGIVSYLVVSYSAVGIATIFLVTPFRTQSRWVGIFSSLFTKLIFPLLVMMFISIGIRIGDFGFTENRYFIVIIGIWSLSIMIYLNLARSRRNIILPVSLAIVALLAVFGPWSAFEVSKTSQNQRFYDIAIKYDMIQDGKIKKGIITDDIDRKEIVGILTYFQRSHKLDDLKYLPPDFSMADMEEVFGFTEFTAPGIEYTYFNYSRNLSEPLPITGYDFLFRVQAYKYQPDGDFYNNEAITEMGRIKLVIDKDLVMHVFQDDAEVYYFDLNEFISNIYKGYGTNLFDGNNEQMVFISNKGQIDIMIAFNNLDGTVDKGKVFNVHGLDADIFIKIK